MKVIKVNISELDFSFSRSSGAGGQNINKVNSKVTLRWNVKKTKSCSKSVIDRFYIKYSRRILENGTIIITSQRFRNQARNIADSIEKLHEMIWSIATPPKIRRPTKPTKASVKKRLKNKKALSDKKKLRQGHNGE